MANGPNKLTADDAYEAAHMSAQRLIDRLQELLGDMPAPESTAINWGHVGTLGSVNAYLSRVVELMDPDQEARERGIA